MWAVHAMGVLKCPRLSSKWVVEESTTSRCHCGKFRSWSSSPWHVSCSSSETNICTSTYQTELRLIMKDRKRNQSSSILMWAVHAMDVLKCARLSSKWVVYESTTSRCHCGKFRSWSSSPRHVYCSCSKTNICTSTYQTAIRLIMNQQTSDSTNTLWINAVTSSTTWITLRLIPPWCAGTSSKQQWENASGIK